MTQPLNRADDKPRDECGVFGVFGHPQAAHLAYVGLYALQHRGQESAGIVASDGNAFHSHKGMGLVERVFSAERLERLHGSHAIGHNRYSTAGQSSLLNAQPFLMQYALGPLAIAHNGNFTNAFDIRAHLQTHGQLFTTTSDTEIIAHMIAGSRENMLENRIIDALKELSGAYSLLCLGQDIMAAVRDPHGFRPLWMGELDGAVLFASETCALDAVEAEVLREVEPGEIVVVTEAGIGSARLHSPVQRAHCVFELLYLSRPDSVVFSESVAERRKDFGRQLAKECPADADIVIGMPESANAAALGYAREAGIRFDYGVARNQYVGRTFIQPSQREREFSVNIKINPIQSVLQGRRVALIDDSLQRGTTLRKSVQKIRGAGAQEVHVRIAAPPTQFPCFYGVDIPTRQELLASDRAVEEVRDYIRADSLGYLSIEGMLSCLSEPDAYCAACFDGVYPTEQTGQKLLQLSFDFTQDRDRE